MILHMINPHTKEIKSHRDWIVHFTGKPDPSVDEFREMCCGAYADLVEVFKNDKGEWVERDGI